MSALASQMVEFHFGAGATSARVVLPPGGVYRIPRLVHAIRALEGCAWVTVAANDLILQNGESAILPPDVDFAVVSAERKSRLVIELWR